MTRNRHHSMPLGRGNHPAQCLTGRFFKRSGLSRGLNGGLILDQENCPTARLTKLSKRGIFCATAATGAKARIAGIDVSERLMVIESEAMNPVRSLQLPVQAALVTILT